MAKHRKGELLTLEIEDLAYGGEGVARLDGYVVFVRGGLPGDRLQARLIQARPNFGNAAIEAVDRPSPERVEAPCPYFGRCGGCRLQHLAYPAQLRFKEKQVRDCLARIGGADPAVVRPILGAPELYGYRNKMEFTIARDPNGQPVVGLHETGRYDAILDTERCLLQSDLLNDVLADVRAFVRERGLSIYDQETGGGLLRFLMLREGKTTEQAMVNIVTSAETFPEAQELATRLRERFPQITGVVQNVNAQKAAVATGQVEHLLDGQDTIQEAVAGLTFQISANSFFQTNTRQAERLFRLVLEFADLKGPEVVFDLYSGTGAITLLLAQRAKAIYGIEVGGQAVEDAVRNAQANRIDNVRFLQGEVRHVLPDLHRKGVRADVVVADPPRAGLHPKAVSALGTLGPQRIVYVSCNPSTLARDLGLLTERGYSLEVVQPLDMFPHTPHIEAVARLSRRG